ncbi:MAG: phosphatase PAP2 family protein [Oscillospiraceae bacterium]|nr:phosphatase PAP2 family protein [Oscillospiraceae bacterium]
MNWEFTFLDWIQQTLRCTFLDWIMPIISLFGDGGVFWIIVTLGLLICKRTRRYGVVSAIALILCLCVGNMLLKPLFARIRPFDVQSSVELLVTAPKDYSFPSGHTQAAFAVAVSLCIWKKRVGIPVLLFACLIAFSRMYLYVHYPTDILGGMISGTLFAFAGNIIANNFIYGEKQQPGKELKAS